MHLVDKKICTEGGVETTVFMHLTGDMHMLFSMLPGAGEGECLHHRLQQLLLKDEEETVQHEQQDNI